MEIEMNMKVPFQHEFADQRPVPLPLEQLRHLAIRSLAESKIAGHGMPAESSGCTTGIENLRPVPFELKPMPSTPLPEPEKPIHEIEMKYLPSPEDLQLLHESRGGST